MGALGVVVIAGWMMESRVIVEVPLGSSSMKFNTAVGLLIASLGLWTFGRHSSITPVAGLVLLFLGIATMLEYEGIWRVSLDEVIVRDRLSSDLPGRMALNTAVCFVLVGIAFVATTSRRIPIGAIALPAAIGLLSISLASLLGYLTALEVIYRWGAATRMAAHTSAAFLVLGAGLLAAGFDHVRSRRQAWLAMGLAGCVAGITVVVWVAVRAEQDRSYQQEADAAARSSAQLTANAAAELMAALQRLDQRWPGGCGSACEADIKAYLHDYSALSRVGWVEADGTPVTYRRTTGDGIALERGGPGNANLRRLVAAHPAPGARTSTGAIDATAAGAELSLAVRRAAETPQLVAALNPARLVAQTANRADGSAGIGVRVDSVEVLPGDSGGSADHKVGVATITLLGVPWSFTAVVRPSAAFGAHWILLGGLLVACFVGTTAYLWQASRAHLDEIRSLNTELEARVVSRTSELAAANAELQESITHETEALTRLRESEQHFRELADAMPQIVWTALPDGSVDYYNRRWYDYTGRPLDESAAWGHQTAMHPSDGREIAARWSQSLATGEPFEAECRFQGAEGGAYRWHLARAVPVRDAVSGSIVRWFGTCTDVEDYKLAQDEILTLNETLEVRVRRRTAELASSNRELADARSWLQSVLDAATQMAIIATDADGIIRVFNAGAERMFQYRAEEMIDRRTTEILHDPAECRERAWVMSQELGRPVSGPEVFVAYARERPFDERQWIYIRKDGSRLEVNLVVAAVRDPAGRITGFVGIATDITTRNRLLAERRQQQEKLLEQTRRAEEANRAKSEFLAAMSHEIRTPMNAILGMADLLWESSLDPEQRHYVDVFRRAGYNLLALINDILDLSKIESGRFELEKVAFVLDDIVSQTTELIAGRARAKGIELRVDRAADVPDTLLGDPLRLRQVLVNLLGNAVKFTEHGEVALSVRNRPDGRPGELAFAIADTGIGIPAEHLARIFDDFTQADASTSRNFGGTGLGLSISRRLVGLMGGTLGVTSTPGQGSTFTFTASFDVADRAAATRAVRDLHGHRALVIDDDPTNRLVLREALSGWGMESRDFADAAGALQELSSNGNGQRSYSLVIVDNQMPDMDGFEAARRIRDMAPELPVVMLASDTERGDESRRIASGVVGFAMKPVNRVELLRVISDAMNVSLATAIVDDGMPPAARPLRLLVAEDFPDNRVLVQAYLKGTPYALTFAEDGRRAVDLFADGEFDLVLMDVQMPGMDGLEATRTIREIERGTHRRRTPIVALTANAQPSAVEASRSAGCDGHLSKPVSRRSLLAAIHQFTNGEGPPAPVDIDLPDEIRDLAREYLEARRGELAEIQELAERQDFTRLYTVAHNIAGSGASFGFEMLTTLGRRMETAARAGDAAGVHATVGELRTFLERVRVS